MTPEQKVASWIPWVERIYQDVSALAYHRRTWWRVRRIIELNPELNPSQTFVSTMVDWYSHSQAMGIRRHVDRGEDVQSLVRLLLAIEAHGPLVTAEQLAASYPEDMRELAQADYQAWLPEGWVQDHLRTLDDVAGPVRRFVNKNVAHLDPREAAATYDDLDRSVDALINAFVSTSFAVKGSAPSADGIASAAEMFDWAAPLRFAWVTPEIDSRIDI